MNPEKFALAVGIAVFVGGSLGLFLHRVLPEKHVTGSGKDMVGAVVGLFTLLSALVLGLLIWTAYGVYAGQMKTWRSRACASRWRRFSPTMASRWPRLPMSTARARRCCSASLQTEEPMRRHARKGAATIR